MSFCDKCGAEVPENVKLCQQCELWANKKKKKSIMPTLIVVVVALAALALLAPLIYPKIYWSAQDKARFKASIIPSSMGTWIKLQQAYHIETGKVGSTDAIGFKTPDGSSFYFYSKFTLAIPAAPRLGIKGKMGEATIYAKNIEDLGDCKAGNEWSISMTDDGKLKLTEPKDGFCILLMPNFRYMR